MYKERCKIPRKRVVFLGLKGTCIFIDRSCRLLLLTTEPGIRRELFHQSSVRFRGNYSFVVGQVRGEQFPRNRINLPASIGCPRHCPDAREFFISPHFCSFCSVAVSPLAIVSSSPLIPLVPREKAALSSWPIALLYNLLFIYMAE